jgi:hypothetical protein
MENNRREALIKEYSEVCNNFRTLTDIRFKLLGLLPIATAAGTAFKGGPADGGSFVFALFGLIATIGLVTYNTRNDQLYDELVSRAAFIERSLGLADGAFASRPHPRLIFRLLDIKFIERSLGLADRAFANRPDMWLISRLRNIKWNDIEWKVDHRTGVGTIYVACIAVWLFLLLTSLLVSLWAPLAFGLAVIATWCARTWIKDKKRQVECRMRSLAAEAVQKAFSTDLLRAAEGREELIDLCTELGHVKRDTIVGRTKFYAAIDRDSSSYYCRASQQNRLHVSLWRYSRICHRGGCSIAPQTEEAPCHSPVSFLPRANEPR